MALAYADHAHDDGSCIRPSVAYIARKTRQSERTVSRILAKMRESKWLLMVKRGSGRGFASEYRINPLWITNPDKLAGGSENSQKRVTLEVVNPDTRGMKRVTPVSSQPSRIIKEPALENHRIQNDAAYFFNTGLQWPSVFDISDLPSARKILRGCEPDRQQAVLDELATIARSGSVPRPLGLLKALVDRLEATGQVSRPDRGAAQKPDRSKNRPIEAVLTVEATLVSDGVKTASLRRLAALRDTISQEGLAKRSSERRAG
jgi:hypothetical protein